MAEATLPCPQCGSNRMYRGGMRYLTNGESVQRWLCRDCNYRFSQTRKQKKPSQKSSEWNLITASNLSLEHQERSESYTRGARILQTGGLNLVTSGTRQETAQREGKTQLTDKTGKIVEFLWNLSQNGVKSNTLGSYGAVLRKLAKNTDLTPEAVKEYLAKDKEWNDATKAMAVIVYGSFLKFNNLS